MKNKINVKAKKKVSKNQDIPKYAAGGALAGLLSGASSGLSVGSVFGPVGGLVGGVIGGIGGLLFGNRAEERQKYLLEQERKRIANQKVYDYTKLLNNKIQQDYFLEYGDNTGITMFDVGGTPYNPNYMLVSSGEGLDNGNRIKTVKGKGGKHQDNIIMSTGDTEYVWSNYNVPGTDMTFSELAKSIDDMFKPDLKTKDQLSMDTLNRKRSIKDRLKQGLREQQDAMLLMKGGNKTKTVDQTQLPAFDGGGFNIGQVGGALQGLIGLLQLYKLGTQDYDATGQIDPNSVNVKNPYAGFMMQPTPKNPNLIKTYSKGGKVKVQKHDVIGPVNNSNRFGRHLWQNYTSDGIYGLELPEVVIQPENTGSLNYNPLDIVSQQFASNKLYQADNTAGNSGNNLGNTVGNWLRDNSSKLQEGLGMVGQIVPSIYSLIQSNLTPEIEPYEGNSYENQLILPRRINRQPLYNRVRQNLAAERYNARQLSPGQRALYNLELGNRLLQEYNNINMQAQAADNSMGMQYDQMLLGLGEQNRGERIRVNTANAQNRAAVRSAGARAAENIGTVARGYTQNLYQRRQNDILTPSLLLNLQMLLTTDEYNKLLKLIN